MNYGLNEYPDLDHVSAHFRGELDIILHDVELLRAGKVFASGVGCLYNSAPSQLELELSIPKQSPNSKRESFQTKHKQGGIYEESDLVEMRASTWDGRVLSARFHGPHSIQHKNRYLLKIVPHSVKIYDHDFSTEPIRRYLPVTIQSVTKNFDIPGSLALLTELTEKRILEDGSERECSESLSRNWFEFSVGRFEYCLYDYQTESQIGIRSRGALLDPQLAFHNWIDALRLVTGQGHNISGFRALREENSFSVLWSVTQKSFGRGSPPLPPGEMSGCHRDLLEAYLNHVNSEKSDFLIPCLRRFWASLDNALYVQELVLSTCVETMTEGLYKSLPPQVDPEKRPFKILKRRIAKEFQKKENQMDSVYKSSIAKAISEASLRSISDKMILVLNFLGVDFTKKEINSWKAIRNSRAHGKLAGPLSPERRSDYRDTLRLFYKLVLGTVGYDGPISALRGEPGDRYQPQLKKQSPPQYLPNREENK